ncbi:hypothetical protein O6H91_Y020600 [Diphasiastrum complanatum]|nr:hypothetical protein O6H91_Y020600 [Diphasiastrum complanatum]
MTFQSTARKGEHGRCPREREVERASRGREKVIPRGRRVKEAARIRRGESRYIALLYFLNIRQGKFNSHAITNQGTKILLEKKQLKFREALDEIAVACSKSKMAIQTQMHEA